MVGAGGAAGCAGGGRRGGEALTCFPFSFTRAPPRCCPCPLHAIIHSVAQRSTRVRARFIRVSRSVVVHQVLFSDCTALLMLNGAADSIPVIVASPVSRYPPLFTQHP